MSSRFCLLVAFLPLGAMLLADTSADTSGDNPSVDRIGDKRERSATRGQAETQPRLPKMTRVREAAALTFADEHHPELRMLLDYLRKERPDDYRQGLYELYQTSERIAQFQDRDDLERYELELKLWQVQSRIQLLSARYKVRQAAGLRQSLAAALEEELDLRVKIREHLRDKAQQRVSRHNESISRLVDGRENELERKLRLLTKIDKNKRSRSKTSSESAAPISKPQNSR